LIELLTYQNPFPGISDQHQMDLMFKVVGSPDLSTWGPSLEKLPGYKTVRKGLYKSTLRTVFKDWDPEALDLLDKLLSPPHLRITAAQALEHSFFKAEPLPCPPEEMGDMPTIHEFEVKKRKMEQYTQHQQSRAPQNNQPDNNSRPPHAYQGRSYHPQQSYPTHPKQPYRGPNPRSVPHFDNNFPTNTQYNNLHNTNNNININPNNNNNTRPKVFISRDRQNSSQPQNSRPQTQNSRTSTPTISSTSTATSRSTSSQQISPQTSPQHTPNVISPPPTPTSGYTRTVPKPTMRISSSRDRSSPSTSRPSFTEEPAIKKQRTYNSSKAIISSNTTTMRDNHHQTPIVITSITDEQKLPPSSTTVSSC